jgi:Uma2 family endonuclease
MTAGLKTKLTAREYLAIERRAEFKSEFLNGGMFAMTGASPRHNFIRENLNGELFGRLKGSPCRAVSSDPNDLPKVRHTAKLLICQP